jgi:UPF0271 protein
MLPCDINCDMGEGIGNDEAIMPFITSANIACGYHAGDEATMRKTVLLAKEAGVAIGAHPSYPGRENFGRTEVNLTAEEVYELVTKQVKLLQDISAACGAVVHHVKPHGALYNKAAKDAGIANAIAQAVKDTDKNLVLYGLSGSCLISEAKAIGLKTAGEAFADRTYQDDGSLTPRSQPDALIEDEAISVRQVLQMVQEKRVTTISGKLIPIVAETICIHGDGKNAAALARKIREALERRE